VERKWETAREKRGDKRDTVVKSRLTMTKTFRSAAKKFEFALQLKMTRFARRSKKKMENESNG
jgi:hypothetical protein